MFYDHIYVCDCYCAFDQRLSIVYINHYVILILGHGNVVV